MLSTEVVRSVENSSKRIVTHDCLLLLSSTLSYLSQFSPKIYLLTHK